MSLSGQKEPVRPEPVDRVDQALMDAGHLLRRAGFGGTRVEVEAAARQDIPRLVDTLVDYEQTPDTFTPPPDLILLDRVFRTDDLSAWWLGQMLKTSRPLQEKMTLFWHGHFATGLSKVHNTRYMYQQNQLFRQNALGRFDDLLSAVYKDPAMLIWLDGERNTKVAPNENWGREVLELFTLGRGNYTEDDVHANSRAFTGWRIAADGTAVFVPRLHDTSVKTLLGQTGAWDGEDAVRILAEHPATGPFLAGTLWSFFASDQPPASAIGRLSRAYYDNDHVIREVVRTLFKLPEFYNAQTRAGHIKSPTEFVVTTLRQLGLSSIDPTLLPRVLTNLGQELFNPPNVGGWPGGASWINAATMLGRFNFASTLTGDAPTKGAIDTDAILAASGADTTDGLLAYITAMLGVAMSGPTRLALARYLGKGSLDRIDTDARIRGLIHLALASPEYQVS